MAFNDRIVQHPRRYKLTEIPGQVDTYDLEPVPGEVVQEGTPLNAENMNKLVDLESNQAITGAKSVPDPTQTGHIANKGYVDGTALLKSNLKETQGNETDTAPTNKLLRESSFARVYRSLSELTGITSTSTPLDVMKAMKNYSLLIADISTYPNVLPTDAKTSFPGGMFELSKVGVNRAIARYTAKENGNPLNARMWFGEFQDAVTGYEWSGWHEVVNDKTAQTITGAKTFTGDVIVPTVPAGIGSATAKSYVDGYALARKEVGVNGVKVFEHTPTAPNSATNLGLNIYELDSGVQSAVRCSHTLTETGYKLKATSESSATKLLYIEFADFPKGTYSVGNYVKNIVNGVSGTGVFAMNAWNGIFFMEKLRLAPNSSGTFTLDEDIDIRIYFRLTDVVTTNEIECEWYDFMIVPVTDPLEKHPDFYMPYGEWSQVATTDMLTDYATTDMLTDYATTEMVDALIPYDQVIRTQSEFEALIASPTWLGATSVALVRQFTYSEANNSGIKVPATVKQIHGFNSAKITVTNFLFNPSTSNGGLWYDTLPTTLDYSIRDLEVDCTGGGAVEFGFGFRRCSNLTNCTGTGRGAGAPGYGFYNCTNLTNCTGTGTGNAGYGFRDCTNLTNCTGTGTTSYGDGFGFYDITYASNCKDGGSKTAMWGGLNKNIDIATCKKTPTTADNNELNA